MHLAAINNQPEVMEFFLSHNKASILRNGDNQTILDISVSLEMKEVAVVIAKHDRYYNPCLMIRPYLLDSQTLIHVGAYYAACKCTLTFVWSAKKKVQFRSVECLSKHRI